MHAQYLLLLFVGWAAAQSNGDLRLVRNGLTSSSYTSGRLEVYYSGQWGTVCDDSWDPINTAVACRQLGFAGSSLTRWATISSGSFGSAPSSRQIWLDDVDCSGTELRLSSCSRNLYGVNNCDHSEDVVIYCNATQSSGDLRLVKSGLTSSSYTSGRLEIYLFGRWGTVCSDFWDLTNTAVACRQLGFAGSRWTTSTSGGFGTAPFTQRIWLDNVMCSGTESRLSSCQRNPFGLTNCFHSRDVAIYCSSTSLSNGDLRLVRNGLSRTSYTSGRLEVYYNRQWGTVCSDLWDSTNTAVACRQLGFAGSGRTSWTTSSPSRFGSAPLSQRIWLDNVNCLGTEAKLSSCSRNLYGINNCLHLQDVAVDCRPIDLTDTVDDNYINNDDGNNVVGIAVGISVAVFILIVVIPIAICVIIGIIVAVSSSKRSRKRTTVTTTAPPPATTATVVTDSQPYTAQPYPAASTGSKKAPPLPYAARPMKMSAYPPQT